MINKLILGSALLLSTSNLMAVYEYDDPTLGNIAIEGQLWQPRLTGTISNNNTTTNFETDLGYKEKKNITSLLNQL